MSWVLHLRRFVKAVYLAWGQVIGYSEVYTGSTSCFRASLPESGLCGVTDSVKGLFTKAAGPGLRDG